MLHARLEGLLHPGLEGLLLLERSKAGLLLLLWHIPCWLGHYTILSELLEVLVLLWESRHLLLHALHVNILQALAWRSNLGMHVRGAHKTCQLRLESWRGSKGTLVRIHGG